MHAKQVVADCGWLVRSDTAFLADNNIMDYSVLLGMNNRRMSYHAASR